MNTSGDEFNELHLGLQLFAAPRLAIQDWGKIVGTIQRPLNIDNQAFACSTESADI